MPSAFSWPVLVPYALRAPAPVNLGVRPACNRQEAEPSHRKIPSKTMHTPLSVVIKRLTVLSDLANQESDYTQNLVVGPGQPFIYGSESVSELLHEPEPCNKALEAFLAALPPPVLNSIVALMYSGRDNEPDAADYWRDLRSSISTREHAIDAVAEKYPRMEYIAKGISLLPSGTQLDDLPSLIAVQK
jgi:hypothetical protein